MLSVLNTEIYSGGSCKRDRHTNMKTISNFSVEKKTTTTTKKNKKTKKKKKKKNKQTNNKTHFYLERVAIWMCPVFPFLPFVAFTSIYFIEDGLHIQQLQRNISVIIGIKHGFSCISIHQVPRSCWKSRPEAAVFNTSQGSWRMLMHWKTMFGRYYCIKTENICYSSCYFLHYFVSPFHRCLTNAIFTDYARSRAGQYTSRNDSKSEAPVRSYWKWRSRALTVHELPC